MITKIYSIYDMKVGCYNFPFTMRNNGEALRSFMDLAQDVNSRVGQHPEDYVLYAVGEFDDERGIVSDVTPHETLGKAAELLPAVSDTVDMFNREAG